MSSKSCRCIPTFNLYHDAASFAAISRCPFVHPHLRCSSYAEFMLLISHDFAHLHSHIQPSWTTPKDSSVIWSSIFAEKMKNSLSVQFFAFLILQKIQNTTSIFRSIYFHAMQIMAQSESVVLHFRFFYFV